MVNGILEKLKKESFEEMDRLYNIFDADFFDNHLLLLEELFSDYFQLFSSNVDAWTVKECEWDKKPTIYEVEVFLLKKAQFDWYSVFDRKYIIKWFIRLYKTAEEYIEGKQSERSKRIVVKVQNGFDPRYISDEINLTADHRKQRGRSSGCV